MNDMASNAELYKPYLALTASQRKLLCFLAYTGKKTDEQMQALYRHGEEIKVDQMKKLFNSLRSFYDTSFYSYRNEYQLHAYHVAPLMLYMRLHQTKRNLADAMLEGTNESHKLTSKDFLAMIDKDF